MTAEDMVHKLHTYSHPQYRFCADKNLLQNAIDNKLYPFDKNVNFDVEDDRNVNFDDRDDNFDVENDRNDWKSIGSTIK